MSLGLKSEASQRLKNALLNEARLPYHWCNAGDEPASLHPVGRYWFKTSVSFSAAT
jgi:hypothetical protein